MLTAYLTLFATAFLAATILPFYSEVILFSMLRAGGDPAILVAVASAGNTLGAVVNWVMGRFLLRYQDRRWFYFKRKQIEKSQEWFNRYGYWVLLLSWMPLGGDALTFIAGVMRVRLLTFVLLVGAGKAARYISIVYLNTWFST